jgi:hypothetical protein
MDDSGSARWKGSQQYWEQLAETYSGMFRENPRSYIFVPMADALYNAGMASQAADTLETGLALLPNSRAGMTLLARLRNEAGDAAGAKALLLDVVSRWPDNTAAVTMLCGIYEGEGLFSETQTLSSVLLDYFPDVKQVARLHDKYSALAKDRLEPARIPAPEPLATPLEHEPEVELELAPFTLVPEPQMEPHGEPVTEPDEEKTGTRSRRRRAQPVPPADSERQLSIVKLESMLSSISKRRK